ncbi:Methylamine utilization protein MauF [Methylorubrum extorquens]
MGLSFIGGLLSTWSPCGYSSLCLLRPVGPYSTRSIAKYSPTFLLHGAGYAVGALILGCILGIAGGLLGFNGVSLGALAGLGAGGLIYGAHQLGFLSVPYPQRRAQVPHDARQRFPVWFIGGLYGLSLGLNYLTYVQTPILYLVTAAAVLSGNVGAAILLFAAFNAGRFLPMAVNYLPVSDITVQNWLARRQEGAALLDGILLVAAGAALLTFAAL